MKMKNIRTRKATLSEIQSLREDFRSHANCQIVRDSILPRGLAEPFVFEVGSEIAGYAGIWTSHFPNRILELFTHDARRSLAPRLVEALVELAGARELEVQTNLFDGRALLSQCAEDVWVENLLFEDGPDAPLERPDLTFRPREKSDEGPAGDWVVEQDGEAIGAGGWLTHYNPPYADLYLEVAGTSRGRGVGAYLVQELRRACRRAGHRPAARCDPGNLASRRAMERGGLRFCGEILVGTLAGATPRGRKSRGEGVG